MTHAVDVIIVGSGIIATATALEVNASGRTVALFAPRSLVEKSASRAAGAMLGAFAEYTADKDTYPDRCEAELRIQSGRLWQTWFDAIADGTPFAGAVRRGTFIVATNMGISDVDNAEFIKARADEHGEVNEWVDPRDVAGIEPHRLSRAQRVLSLPNEGYVDSSILLETVDTAISHSPGILRIDSEAHLLAFENDRPAVTAADGTHVNGEQLVIAAGVNTIELLSKLGIDTPLGDPILLGGRGTSVVVSTDIQFPGVLRTPNRDFACGSHIVPLGQGQVYLGATNRLETTDFSNPRPSLGEVQSLSHSLSNEMNVRLRTAEITQIRSGFRPVSSDGYPIIGRTRHDRVLVATGSYRNGILMAPAIARSILADLDQPYSASSVFSPIGREKLFADRDINSMMIASLRQVVSFVQEPDGNLPFDRAAELEGLLAAFLGAAVNSSSSDLIERFVRLTDRYPISEAMPLLMYEIAGQ